MKRKTYLSHRIQLYVFTSIIFVASLFLLADIITENIEYRKSTEKVRQEFQAQQKQYIKDEVEYVYNKIQEERSKMNQLIFETTKPLVEQAYNVADHLYNKYHGIKSDEDIKQLIKDALTPVRFFEGKQYFFIINIDSEGVMLDNQPRLPDSNLREYADPKGNYVLNDMVKIAKEQKEGFYTYYWTKPGSEGNDHKKSSYIKLFEPLGWIIGTGVYFEDYEITLKKRLLDEIGAIRFGQHSNGYIFVVSYDGITLMNGSQRSFIGKSIVDLRDVNNVNVFQEELKAAKKPEGDFIHYSWPNPLTGHISQKTSFVKGIRDWEWLFGAGFYFDDIEPEINKMHQQIFSDNKQEILEYLLIVLSISTLLIFIRRVFTRRLNRDIATLMDFFKKAAHEDRLIDTSLIRYKEFSELAEDANKMFEERIAAKNSLKELNKELNERVNSEIRKNEKHVQILHEQKKLADMGQMINAIAHQWRQPLNNIHLISQMLYDIDNGESYQIDKNTLYQQHSDLVDYMSRTIDDFRNYFSVKKKKHEFSLSDEIRKTLSLLNAQLNAGNIHVELNCLNGSSSDDKPDTFFGFSGEFRQIIMNLLSNARDAINDKRKNAGTKTDEYIIISVDTSEDSFEIKITNTGDNIPQEILSKIFNPYFTTKEEGKGTGIGLYLSKTIIEKEMGGKIKAENIDNGVTFTITLPRENSEEQP